MNTGFRGKGQNQYSSSSNVLKGVTASYAGVSETMIQFVIYEHLRGYLLRHHNDEEDKGKMVSCYCVICVFFLLLLLCGAFPCFTIVLNKNM